MLSRSPKYKFLFKIGLIMLSVGIISIILTVLRIGGLPPATAEEDYGGLEVKDGVDLSDISDKITEKYDDINDAFNEHAGRDGVATSGRDPSPDRVPTTKHESGEAIDLRTRDLSSDQVNTIVDDLQEKLGDDYDVVNEHSKPGAPHIHIEYDPNAEARRQQQQQQQQQTEPVPPDEPQQPPEPPECSQRELKTMPEVFQCAEEVGNWNQLVSDYLNSLK